MSGASMTMALLQSLCTAVLTINGIRVGIGLAALGCRQHRRASAFFSPRCHSHPMLVLAVAGAVVNLRRAGMDPASAQSA